MRRFLRCLHPHTNGDGASSTVSPKRRQLDGVLPAPVQQSDEQPGLPEQETQGSQTACVCDSPSELAQVLHSGQSDDIPDGATAEQVQASWARDQSALLGSLAVTTQVPALTSIPKWQVPMHYSVLLCALALYVLHYLHPRHQHQYALACIEADSLACGSFTAACIAWLHCPLDILPEKCICRMISSQGVCCRPLKPTWWQMECNCQNVQLCPLNLRTFLSGRPLHRPTPQILNCLRHEH